MLNPSILQKVETYIKYCTLYEVLCYNNLNQVLLQKVKAPQFLLINLCKILETLGCFNNAADLQKCVIISTLKCMAVSLRQNQAVIDFLTNKEQLILVLIKLMKQNVSNQPILNQGMMVFKQIMCTDSQVYNLIEKQLETKYIKIFISQLMMR